jgi:hypothetical protein
MCKWARAALVALSAGALALGGPLPGAAAAAGCPNEAFRTGPSALLPDCRAYEQVSPAEKNSEDAFGEGALSQTTGEAQATGAKIAYTSKNVFAQSLGAGVETGYLASREESGWRTSALTPRVLQPLPADTIAFGFSSDLSQAAVRVPVEALTPEAPRGVYNIFIRHPDGGYALVSTAAPSVPIPAGCNTCYQSHDVSVFTGASRDFAHVIFETNESLSTTPAYPADPEGNENLYESNLGEPAAQRVHPVGILPDGVLAAGGAQPGAGGGNFNGLEIKDVGHAISADGSHVLFTAKADTGGPDPAQTELLELYDRIGGPTGTTVEVSAPGPSATESHCKTPYHNCTAQPAQFWAAAEDGSVVLFTSKAELTTQSNTGKESAGNDLYRYDVAKATLTDLTPEPEKSPDSGGASVQGVVGASSDGSSVYFVAQGVLAGKNAEGRQPTAGQDNLYLSSPVGTVFIATLAAEEGEALGDSADWTSAPEFSQAYVTPDGGHLAFTSLLPLTGYDNTDRNTEKPDKEVFEYSAGRLECASCNPNPHIRPTGEAFIGRDIEAQSEGLSPLYPPRAISDDGSFLFFSSSDALGESHTNHVKIYEYESGAAHLISSGSGEENDIFMNTSANGGDVFFASAGQLAPSDHDGAVDVYDARVGGGFAQPPPAPSPCQGEGCLPVASVPPSFSHPGSALNGAGNLPSGGVAPTRNSSAPSSRAQRLARALKACRRKPKPKRAACERRARRRYGHVGKHSNRRKSARGRR